LTFDFIMRAKLEAFHALDDLFVEFVGAEGLAMDEMRIWGSRVAAGHPWVVQDLAEGSAVGGVCDEHSGQEVFAIWEK